MAMYKLQKKQLRVQSVTEINQSIVYNKEIKITQIEELKSKTKWKQQIIHTHLHT